jgi:hypothetical protein
METNRGAAPAELSEQPVTRAELTRRVTRRADICFRNPNLTDEQKAKLGRVTTIAQLATYFDIGPWKEDVIVFVKLTDSLMAKPEEQKK